MLNFISPNELWNRDKYEKKFDNNGIGAGLSCGVDSLCCFQDYYFNNCHKSIKITHACNFHVGGAVNLQQYNKRLNNVRKFVQKTDLKLLNVVTNFQKSNEFPYSTIHIFRNVPVVLCFQKLFKKYYYSSCDPYPDLKIFNCNESDIYIKIYDPIIIPLLSTEETEFSLHGSQYVRNDKILKISKNHLTYNHLDVCVDSHYLMENNKQNCSKCEKCLRTMARLDSLRELENYKNVFDLIYWFDHKKKFLENLDINDPFQLEIHELFNSNNKIN